MKIALVSIPFTNSRIPPFALASIGAVLRRANHEVFLLDLNLELLRLSKNEKYFSYSAGYMWKDEILYNKLKQEIIDPHIDKIVDEIVSFQPDILALSVWNGRIADLVVKLVKKKLSNLPVIAGGPVASNQFGDLKLLPSPNIECVVSGEGEEIIIKILEHYKEYGEFPLLPGVSLFKNGEITNGGCENYIENLDRLPFTDFTGLKLDEYYDIDSKAKVVIPLLRSRGCPFNCAFCMDRVIWGKKYKYQTGIRSAEEIKYLYEKYGYRDYFFLDLCINGSEKSFVELLIEIAKLDLPLTFCAHARFSENIKPDVVKLMKKANFIHLTFGLESASNRILKLMNKKITKELVERNMRLLFENQILININLIAGFPGEEEEDIIETAEFVKKNSQYIWSHPSIVTCSVAPNSDLAVNPQKYGIELDYNDPEKHETWVGNDGRLTLEVRKKRVEFLNNEFRNVKFHCDRVAGNK